MIRRAGLLSCSGIQYEIHGLVGEKHSPCDPSALILLHAGCIEGNSNAEMLPSSSCRKRQVSIWTRPKTIALDKSYTHQPEAGMVSKQQQRVK